MYFIIFLLWLIFNGKITIEIILLGLFLSGLMCLFLWKFMDYHFLAEVQYLRKTKYFLQFFLLLLKEILKANFATVKIIFSSKYEIEPTLVKFRPPLKTKMAKVMLANAITLTPGTITVSIEEDEFLVHCLDKSLGKGIGHSKFVELLKKIEEPLKYKTWKEVFSKK